MAQRVLLIGGTGLLGEAVARGFHAAGFGVQVMSRNPQRAEIMLSDVGEVVEGDALRHGDVNRALAGCDAVHISIDNDREQDCVAYIVDAAISHRIQRITYVSGTTVCEENRWFPLVDRKMRCERTIARSDIPYTIFCPGWFMEMLARFVRNGRAMMFGWPKRRWHFVAVREFARMVVASYGKPEAVNRRFYIHGPEALTVTDALESYCRVLHPHIGAVRHVPSEVLRVVAALGRDAELRAGVDMVAYLEKVGERGDPAEANAILGPPCLTLAKWLESHRADSRAATA